MKHKKILLASHGTDGARAAERYALDLCSDGAELHQLVVVPDFWKGMMGDDWLNNAHTRDTYGRYVESELEKELLAYVQLVINEARTRKITYSYRIVLGKPEACLLELCEKENFDLAVIGSPRPKGMTGIRSRMALEPLARSLETPLVIVPYPHG